MRQDIRSRMCIPRFRNSETRADAIVSKCMRLSTRTAASSFLDGGALLLCSVPRMFRHGPQGPPAAQADDGEACRAAEGP